MCIIIDINVLPCVFENSNPFHNNYKPIKDWIVNGKGKIVYGGTKYISELNEKYLNLFILFRSAGLAKLAEKNKVDEFEDLAEKTVRDPDFDDPHLIALLQVTGCKIIASNDKRAYPFFRHSLFFKPARKRPKIYNQFSHSKLLIDNNIAEFCKPCAKTTNKQKQLIS